MNWKMEDKDLQAKLLDKIDKLEQKIDWIGETPIRHKLSELIVAMRKVVRDGVQS